MVKSSPAALCVRYRIAAGGVKLAVSVALGITDTRCGAIFARSTVFSRLVFETQMTWSTHRSDHSSTLLMWMDAASAKPKSEWSVKHTLSPSVPAWKRASWHKFEVVWCPCTSVIRSRRKMSRSSGSPAHRVGSVTVPGGSRTPTKGTWYTLRPLVV